MSNLHKKKCIACSGDTPALSEAEIVTFNKQINNWNSIKNQDGVFMLSKYFKFKNFEESLAFINKTSTIAENEGAPSRYLVWLGLCKHHYFYSCCPRFNRE